MQDEAEVIDQSVVPVPYEAGNLTIFRSPKEVLAEAHQAAKALTEVMANKPNPVVFNKERYLEFEDWQTVGAFYKVTAKVISTNFVQFGDVQGFESVAVALDKETGMEISRAESMCLNDEEKWRARSKYEWRKGADGKSEKVKVGEEPVPLFQLRSMAQTRACAKALRNIFSWVVVLGGYKPTVAEEMTGNEVVEDRQPRNSVQPPQRKAEPSQSAPTGPTISEAQSKRFYAIWKQNGYEESQVKEYLLKEFGVEHSKDILRADYDEICATFGG